MPDDKDLPADIEAVAKKLNVDVSWARELTQSDLTWLLDRCPFLQIVNPQLVVEEEEQGMQVVTAESSGWDIHVYNDAMSSSPGRFLFGGGYFSMLSDDDEGGGGAIVNPGKGTVYNQATMTAMEMVTLAHAKGWQGIQIVDGHERMKRGAWIKATELGMTVEGFEPSAEDKKVLARVQQTSEEIEAKVKKSPR